MTVRRPLGRIIADRPGAVNDKGLARASRVVDGPRPARVLVAKGAADRWALTAIYRLRYWFCLLTQVHRGAPPLWNIFCV